MDVVVKDFLNVVLKFCIFQTDANDFEGFGYEISWTWLVIEMGGYYF